MINDKIIDYLKNEGFLNPIILSEKIDDNKIKCNTCMHRCIINEGGAGRCRTVINNNNTLFTTIYSAISSYCVDPIEKKPVFHYKPGSNCYSVGSFGCNFRCIFCQNWEIAYKSIIDENVYRIRKLTPEMLVKEALESKCKGVAWTYNEPSIWLDYTLDCAKLCKDAGLYTVYVTNGYATPEALDLIGPYLDVYRVDIKSMDNLFYKELIGGVHIDGILETTKRAKELWNMHIEIITNIIPGWNDSEENINNTAKWIYENLGKNTPWHLTRFFPYGKLSNIEPTPYITLQRAYEIAKNNHLNFIYFGNIHTETGENTYCPKCGALNIERCGFTSKLKNINTDGNCNIDNEDLNVHL